MTDTDLDIDALQARQRLLSALAEYPFYRIIVHATSVAPPSPWAYLEDLNVNVDHEHKAIVIEGELS